MKIPTALALLCLCTSALGDTKPNILFIAIDDMNDWTGFLGGHPQAITPNMDKLASKGVNFTNAHCSAPGCSPSRNALLFGVEPFKSGLYPFYDPAIVPELHQKYTSLPRFFKENGYQTFGSGKIHHGTKGDNIEWSDYHEPTSGKKTFAAGKGYQLGNSGKMSFRPTTHPDEQHRDHQFADYGIKVLKQKHDKPFFLAVGIVKPHLPFDCPQRFFDALPTEINPPPVKENDLIDIPAEGNSMRRAKDDVQFRKDKSWQDVRRSYLACISWADYNIGRVLDALAQSPYADNTIVVLWSDHGYHLGEKKSFRKFTLWQEATRVPFIILDPRQKNTPQNRTCAQPVSLINIYRTLAEMSELKAPDYVDGTSLVPQLVKPTTPVKAPAIISWGRGNYAVCSENWRYIRYFDGTEELYDKKKDANEWDNLAKNPEYAGQKGKLAAHLPKTEAPTIKNHINTWSVYGADKKVFNKGQQPSGKTKKKKKK